MNDKERWLQAKSIFLGAMNQATDQRSSYVAAQCSDPELEGEVRSLLDAAEQTGETWDASALPRASRNLDREDRVGPYRLLEHVGRGGMSDVYLAERADRRDDRTVALKLLHGRWLSQESRIRFDNERRILSSLEHPYIARMYDGGISRDGTPFLVIEHVQGEPIDRFCTHAELSLDECVELFRKVCEAVDFAHRNLVVHRDLKPDNILVSEDRVPHLLDFGIAKVLDSTADRSITRQGMAPLTPAYASPEQIREGPITFSSDVFSLGILLYRLLTGQMPLGGTWQKRLAAIDAGTVPRPPSRCLLETRDVAPGSAETWGTQRRARRLADGLDQIVLKALAIEPQERYATVRELSDDLLCWQRGFPIQAEMASFRIRAKKFLRRNVLGVTLAVAALLLTFIGTIALMVFAQRAAEERSSADLERARAQEVTAFLVEIFDLEPTSPDTVQGLKLILSSAVDEAESRFQDRPKLQAEVLAALGESYAHLGLHEESRQVFLSSLQSAARGGINRLEIADIQNQLAESEIRIGDLAAAKKRLEVLTRTLGDQPEAQHLKHQAMLQLASLLMLTGEQDAGEELIVQALDAAESRWGADSEPAAIARIALGIHQAEMGRSRAAERELGIAFEILDQDMLTDVTGRQALQALATLQRRRGDLESSSAVLQRIIDWLEAKYGDDHFELAVYYRDLARCRAHQGDDVGAEALFRRALENVVDGNPQAGMVHLTSTQSLARVLARRGKLEEAESLAREALALTEKMMGAKHFSRSFTIQDLGRFELLRGNSDEAIRLLREAIHIQQAVFPPGHQFLLTAQVDLARAILQQANYPQAEALLEAVWTQLEPALQRGDNPPGLGNVPLPLDVAETFTELYSASGQAELAVRWAQTVESLRAHRVGEIYDLTR